MIDMTSEHIVYIFYAFIFAACILIALSYWTKHTDRKIRIQLKKRESLAIVFHKRGN